MLVLLDVTKLMFDICIHFLWCPLHYMLKQKIVLPIEQRDLKNVNNCLNTNIYSYLETSGAQRSNLYLNVVHFFNTSVN
jgi:hypothetical protein